MVRSRAALRRVPGLGRRAPLAAQGVPEGVARAGASATASFELDERAFEYWDDATGAWVMPVGDFKVYVGSSSRDVRAIGTYTVTP